MRYKVLIPLPTKSLSCGIDMINISQRNRQMCSYKRSIGPHIDTVNIGLECVQLTGWLPVASCVPCMMNTNLSPDTSVPCNDFSSDMVTDIHYAAVWVSLIPSAAKINAKSRFIARLLSGCPLDLFLLSSPCAAS